MVKMEHLHGAAAFTTSSSLSLRTSPSSEQLFCLRQPHAYYQCSTSSGLLSTRTQTLAHRTPLSTGSSASRALCKRSLLKAAVSGSVSNNGSLGGRGPRNLNGPFFSSDTNGELRWRDRVALYAQFSPEETLQCILDALKQNGPTGVAKDDGIEALYTFANFDVFEVDHRFFGRRMDLGQFERFRRVIITKPYSMLLHYAEKWTLSSLRLSRAKFISRIRFRCAQDEERTFCFALSKVKLGDHEKWMVDSVLEEEPIPEDSKK